MQKLNGLVLLVVALVFSIQVWADDYPTCAMDAAQEFTVPEKVFKAMVLSEGWAGASLANRKEAESRKQYGPMGLGSTVIPVIARGLGVSSASIKEDACTNYRAAAWWFANKTSSGQPDIWAAVTQYYYGSPNHSHAYATERVKRIYDGL